jgi:hypothetical protein
MTEYLPTKPATFTQDLNEFPADDKSIHLSVSAKNINRLGDLDIENIWLIGANEKELKKILPLIRPKYLNLYQVLAKDLSILETLDSTETIILEWNTKSETLWDISKNTKLRTLEIRDFGKLQDISPLASATQLESLTLAGGINKKLHVATLEPLRYLTNLKYLTLNNLRVDDESLRPLGQLTGLEELSISNQFDIKEYAWLATRLKQTKCELFNGSMKVSIKGVNNELVYDTMITGKKRPFLLSTKDGEKIKNYIDTFEKLKQELAD